MAREIIILLFVLMMLGLVAFGRFVLRRYEDE